MKNVMLEKWKPLAGALPEEPARVGLPFDVLLGEAVDVARFASAYSENVVDAHGNVTRPGLEQAVSGGRFRPELGQEILELTDATQAAQTAYILTVPETESPLKRAQFVLGELVDALEFLLDDGVEDEDDTRFEQLAERHASASSQDAVALALEDYAGLCARHRERLDQLGAFEVGMVDEAVALAKSLRDHSAKRRAGAPVDEQQRALDLRNRLAAMLYERMQTVRAAARYVFRHHPDVVRRVTSAYQRRRVARYRREQAAAAAASATSSALDSVNAPTE